MLIERFGRQIGDYQLALKLLRWLRDNRLLNTEDSIETLAEQFCFPIKTDLNRFRKVKAALEEEEIEPKS